MKDIVFVSDMFVEQYAGGAELTTAAIMAAASKLKTKVGGAQSFRLTPAMIRSLNMIINCVSFDL